jgi:hypothetical protein
MLKIGLFATACFITIGAGPVLAKTPQAVVDNVVERGAATSTTGKRAGHWSSVTSLFILDKPRASNESKICTEMRQPY